MEEGKGEKRALRRRECGGGRWGEVRGEMGKREGKEMRERKEMGKGGEEGYRRRGMGRRDMGRKEEGDGMRVMGKKEMGRREEMEKEDEMEGRKKRREMG